ncbi:hypothetical protein [Scytonema sp. UIC 10036]|nr:hypothetical protein [Scytonema sp. UIC 10036]
MNVSDPLTVTIKSQNKLYMTQETLEELVKEISRFEAIIVEWVKP